MNTKITYIVGNAFKSISNGKNILSFQEVIDKIDLQ
jgi:hypothetical protein